MPGFHSVDLATASPQLVVDASGFELIDESFAGHSLQQSVYEQYAHQLLRRSSGQHASSAFSRVTAANAYHAPSFGALPADSAPLIWDQGVRTGMFLIAFGLAAAFLPSVGLQFKALAWLGGYAPMAGVTIGGLGALLVFFSMIGSPIKAVALSGLAAVMLAAVGLGIPWARTQLGWAGAPLASTATEEGTPAG